MLALVGMRLPRTTLEAILTYLWFRFLLLLRGFDFVARDESQIAPQELMRADVCRSVADTTMFADAIRGAIFHARFLLMALRAGEPARVAHGLSAESAYLGASGSKKWARTQQMIARAREASDRAGTPAARAIALAMEGSAYCFNLRPVAAIERIEAAIAIFRQQVPGSAWEVTTSRFVLLAAYHYTCRYAEQRAEQEAALKDALARGDTYAAVMFRIGVLNRIWWMAADPSRSRRELAEAVRDWPAGGAFDLVDFHKLVAQVYVDIYEGMGTAAYARISRDWPALERSLLLRLEPIHLEAMTMRARAALCASADPSRGDRAALIRDARRSLRGFERVETPTNRWALLSIKVGIAALEGRNDESSQLLGQLAVDEAEEAWTAQQLARWVLGVRRGGTEGDAQIRMSKEALASRGVTPDERLINVLFPGLEVRPGP